jgi:Na+-driven multidrug efflux pump
VVFITFARPLLGLFTEVEAVQNAGVLALRIICLGYVFFSYGMVISQSFNGAGDTFTPMVVNIICFWFIQIPLGFVLAKTLGMGLAGVCWAIVLSEIVLAIIFIILFRQGKWKTVAI